ncbi:TetR family transcriptional regulator [Chryseobacterium sp. T16E-39]|uniref:TetR/AcrR family transcriptional regulator n=1 Tax=Chryseobacterium sp. T16E-39 TaxID=2015076 RepID=UPI000B5B2D17|nr:TetR/AcrR family transcriptional regulator [Chryseobacterium sp. T16E-39]ASK32738.1 TetR family transcriptional regulator [Chryseobacterium sp. T16E-39]
MEKEKVKDRIIRVASDLFYKQGFNSTGINQIIAEADIAIGSLYNHFSSKNELLKVYLIKEEIKWFDGFEKDSSKLVKAKDKIFALVDYRKNLQNSSGFSGCHFIKINAELGDSNPVISEFVMKHKEKQKVMIKDLVTQYNQEGGSVDSDEVTNVIYLLLEGAVVISTINKDSAAFDQSKKIIQGLLS